MLLADSGRFAYAGTDLSATLHVEYGRNASAHNTLVIDGCDQLPLPAVNTEPISINSYRLSQNNDTVFGSMSLYDNLVGKATHTRGVYFERGAWGSAPDGDFAVVIDSIDSGGKDRTVMATWHTHPNATVVLDPKTLIGKVTGVDASTGQLTEAQVCVIPAKNNVWSSSTIIRGQYQNKTNGLLWQGWYSQSYDDAWEASTLVYNGVVPADSKSSLPFGWLLLPSNQSLDCGSSSIDVLSVQGNVVSVSVMLPGGVNKVMIDVPIGE